MHSAIKFTKVFLLILFIFLAANFALNNQDQIAVDLGPFAKTINIKLYIFAFIIFVLGLLTASFYFMLDSLKKTLKVKKQARVIKKLEKTSSSIMEDLSMKDIPVESEPDHSLVPETDPGIDDAAESVLGTAEPSEIKK